MVVHFRCLVPPVAVLLIAVGLCPARDTDAGNVKDKLDKAKQAYTAAADDFKKAVGLALDKREEDARKSGNKKAVDQIKAERTAFEKKGELPPSVPGAARDRAAAARVALDKSYVEAVKDYVRLKMDAAADAAEKERQQFLVTSALELGKKKYLSVLKHSNVKVEANHFTNNGTVNSRDGGVIKLNGSPVPHTLFTHPDSNSTAQVSYTLNGRWAAFRAMVGLPTVGDVSPKPLAAITFELIGDDKSLWKSNPIQTADKFEMCEVRVDKVKVLTLRAHCPGICTYAWPPGSSQS